MSENHSTTPEFEQDLTIEELEDVAAGTGVASVACITCVLPEPQGS